ncbi:MAG: beta-1,3-glucanase family protein [Chlamydiales bacterium]|nr:beta-1,3-glucanase family protein [Chlamydiales bacterium]
MVRKCWLTIFACLFATYLYALPSRDFYINFSEQFLSEQKSHLAATGVTLSPPTGYMPFTIVNNSGQSDSDVYVLILVNTYTNIITFTKNQDGLFLGELSVPTPKTYVSAMGSGSYPLSYFPVDSTTTNGRIFYLPTTLTLSSARIYYSVGGPIDWLVPYVGAVQFQPQDFENPLQDNYYTLFDKQEFTMDGGDRYIMNPTLVDYYGIPLSFSISYTDYTQITPTPTVAYAGLPPSLTSTQIFTNYTTATATLPSTPDGGTEPKWQGLYLTYAPPSGSSGLLRILSPDSACSAIGTPLFPLDYFIEPDYTTCSWLSNVWYNVGNTASFQEHPLYIDLSTAGPTYGVAEGVMDGSGNFNFSVLSGTGGGSTLTLPLPNSSKAFFTSTLSDYSPTPTSTGDPNVSTAIWQGLSAAVISGVIPLVTSESAPLSQSFIRTQTLFTNNSLIPCTGPWYDFYSGTFIGMGSGNYTQFYTTPYGDYLGTSGTVTVTNIANAGAHVITTIGDMSGIPIPDPFNDSNNYTVIFNELPSGVSVTFGSNPDFTSNPSVNFAGQTFDTVSGATMYLGVTYGGGNYIGLWGTQLIPSAPAMKPILPNPGNMSLAGGPGGTLTITVGASP